MPFSPKKPCVYPGCSVLIKAGNKYCDKHEKSTRRSEKKHTDQFYSTIRWQKLRKAYRSQHPICEKCNTKYSQMVDHIIPIKEGGARMDECNLMALCWKCHSVKTAEDSKHRGK